jgi:tetratricopeptide (TPR) repeat protein
LTTALELLLRRPETADRDRRELELQLALGPVLLMTRGYAAPESVAVYRRARTLCERLGDSPESFSALWGIFMFELSRGMLPAALSAAEQLRAIATRLANVDLLLEANVAIGVCLVSQGRLTESRPHLEHVIALYDPERHAGHAFVYGQDPLVVALAYRAWALAMQGDEPEALAAIDEALRRAEAIGHAFSHAPALYFASMVSDLRDDYASMLGYADRLVVLAGEHKFPFWQTGGMGMRGRALAGQGRHAEGLEAMLTALELSRAPSGGLGLADFLRNAAQGHLSTGDVERALAVVAEGLEICGRCAIRSSEAEFHRIRAEALARNPATSEDAAGAFRRAMAVAREQGAMLYLRRAATSFAAYLRERGRDVEATHVLREAMLGS